MPAFFIGHRFPALQSIRPTAISHPAVSDRMIARKLSLPAGIAGRIAGCVMTSLNQHMNMATVECIRIEPRHTSLDIGFGGGFTLYESDILQDLLRRAGFTQQRVQADNDSHLDFVCLLAIKD